MRFLMIVKANKESEAGIMPTEAQLAEMGSFNEEMMKAGVMVDGAGVHESSDGARVKFSGGKPTVVNGPFGKPEDLLAGFWIIKANSKEEAIDWAKRVPFQEGEVEVRRYFEMEDFVQGPAIEHERELSKQLEAARA